MTNFLVRWEMDIEAGTPREAAELAREVQLDRFSEATVFDVKRGIYQVQVDLEDPDCDPRLPA